MSCNTSLSDDHILDLELTPQPFPLLSLPLELTLLVISFLPHPSLLHLRATSHQLHALLQPQILHSLINPHTDLDGASTLSRAISDGETWGVGMILSKCTPTQIRRMSQKEFGKGLTLMGTAVVRGAEMVEVLRGKGVEWGRADTEDEVRSMLAEGAEVGVVMAFIEEEGAAGVVAREGGTVKEIVEAAAGKGDEGVAGMVNTPWVRLQPWMLSAGL